MSYINLFATTPLEGFNISIGQGSITASHGLTGMSMNSSSLQFMGENSSTYLDSSCIKLTNNSSSAIIFPEGFRVNDKTTLWSSLTEVMGPMGPAGEKGDTGLLDSSIFRISASTNNLVLGSNSLNALTTGTGNITIGNNAGQSIITTIGNVGLGHNIFSNTVCSGSIAIGESAMGSINASNAPTHTMSIAIGYYAGYNTNASNVSNYTNSIAIGYGAQFPGNNAARIGDSNTTVYVGALALASDNRDKIEIRDTILGLDFITKIRPVDFRWNTRDAYREIKEIDGKVVEMKYENDGSKAGKRYHHGIIAQELREIIQETGLDFGGFQDLLHNGGEDALKVNYLEFIGPIIKSIQQLKEEIDELKKKI